MLALLKEVIKRWYPESPFEHFVKVENHRALEDILQSVQELKHYRTYFFTMDRYDSYS